MLVPISGDPTSTTLKRYWVHELFSDDYLKKADDSFYGVVFASKGTSQLQGLYDEAGKSVDRSIREFDNVIAWLRAAKVPGA